VLRSFAFDACPLFEEVLARVLEGRWLDGVDIQVAHILERPVGLRFRALQQREPFILRLCWELASNRYRGRHLRPRCG
jgi:hypothetical protein